jgi:hypothetical protein
VDTVSKVGLVLAAGGFSVWAAEGASWVVWFLLLAGLVLAFGPDLVAILRPRWQRRQELSTGVPCSSLLSDPALLPTPDQVAGSAG